MHPDWGTDREQGKYKYPDRHNLAIYFNVRVSNCSSTSSLSLFFNLSTHLHHLTQYPFLFLKALLRITLA
jgi:hypothetical protein